ncbi:hypothetical protein PVAP13_1KG067777 [Panicum virgatum]|uniref:Uncharacterized protein n=1 Tax=Panicum virgatum TaxID=38727 RepID=A0A8T0XFQ1_PANVG|nr:hypothetical protein PVAP13_1KG067777 [Panicum virgatum]
MNRVQSKIQPPRQPHPGESRLKSTPAPLSIIPARCRDGTKKARTAASRRFAEGSPPAYCVPPPPPPPPRVPCRHGAPGRSSGELSRGRRRGAGGLWTRGVGVARI